MSLPEIKWKNVKSEDGSLKLMLFKKRLLTSYERGRLSKDYIARNDSSWQGSRKIVLEADDFTPEGVATVIFNCWGESGIYRLNPWKACSWNLWGAALAKSIMTIKIITHTSADGLYEDRFSFEVLDVKGISRYKQWRERSGKNFNYRGVLGGDDAYG